MSADVVHRRFERVDETQGKVGTALGQVVRGCFVDVGFGAFAQNDRLGRHFAARVRTRLRKPSKKPGPTVLPGCEVAPSMSKPRSALRSWSLRINSRTYSLLVL